MKSHKSARVQCFSLPFQAWEDLLKFDTTGFEQLVSEVSSVKALKAER